MAHLGIFLLLSTAGNTTIFFLAGPGNLHEIAVSAFSRSPSGRANTFSFLTPRISVSAPHSPQFLALVFPSFCPFFCCCLVPPKLLYGQHLFLVSSNTLPYFLDYASPPYSSSPFSLLSLIQPYQLELATSFLACSLLYVVISTFCVSIWFKSVHSQFCS